ncbi:uncharacterized protein LOC132563213 [Ylistrum balloti]|uniref:uncharacterized protein LOC132563213 n=1 Tax=Ylistrum balloti TaxID=509963 RepID=UPI0029058772|nr:uncharacterized protein LOC132563213 [Ylistrum balloti]
MEMLSHMFPLTSSWLQITKDGANAVDWSSNLKGSDEILQKMRNHSPHLAVIGRGNDDITSLLFQGAVSCGAKDFTVVFICPHPLDKIPSAVHGMPKPEANILQNVHFQYLKNVEELVNYCASIHTRSVMPDVVMVDDLNHYIGQEKKGEHGLAKLCAHLLDCVTFISSKNERDLCRLIVGCQECHEIQSYTLEKFRLTPVLIEGTSVLNQRKLSTKMENVEITLQYKVAQEAIFLKDVEFIRREQDQT